ncbi:MAG: glycosyltransferase [Anaerolineales bacterium]|nr:glycosyltransferase [Anaerolineales bacterium]
MKNRVSRATFPSPGRADKESFDGRLAVQQRVLPTYRAPFFETLAGSCTGGMSLLAGPPRAGEIIPTAEKLEKALFVQAGNIHLMQGALYLCFQQGLGSWLANWDPDALIVEANPRYLAIPAAVRWMHRHNRPVIGWGLGAPPVSGPLSELMAQLWRKFVCQFDALISYSKRGAAQYAALGFPEGKITIAPNAVSPRPTEPMPVRSDEHKGQFSILFVGRLQSRKRIDNLLRACASLKKDTNIGSVQLVIVGDGPVRKELEALAAEVYPAAEFVGARHGEVLDPYFDRADLFVLPGTGGLAVQQAMGYGLPVIVAQGDGTQDDLVREGNGWQIPSDDQQALTRTMQQALSDPARLRQMGAESYRIVSEEINLEKMVEAFIKALNGLE